MLGRAHGHFYSFYNVFCSFAGGTWWKYIHSPSVRTKARARMRKTIWTKMARKSRFFQNDVFSQKWMPWGPPVQARAVSRRIWTPDLRNDCCEIALSLNLAQKRHLKKKHIYNHMTCWWAVTFGKLHVQANLGERVKGACCDKWARVQVFTSANLRLSLTTHIRRECEPLFEAIVITQSLQITARWKFTIPASNALETLPPIRNLQLCVGSEVDRVSRVGFSWEVSFFGARCFKIRSVSAEVVFTRCSRQLNFVEVWRSRRTSLRISHLVDPTSSYMLVSKVKPCMSQYECFYGETANGSLNQLRFIWWLVTRITGEILQPIRASKPTLWKVSICSILNQPRSSGL